MEQKRKLCRTGKAISTYVSPKAFEKFIIYRNLRRLTNREVLERMIARLK